MFLYQKYIIQNILMPLSVVGFSATTLVWLSQTIKYIHLINKGVEFSYFLYLIILILPLVLYIILPFITTLATIYTYNKLLEERQLIILKNSGLDNSTLARPALFLACFITLISYYFSLNLLPLTNTKLKANLIDLKDSYVSVAIAEKTFNQISKSITIYVSKKSPDGDLEGIVIFDNRKIENPAIIFAKLGNFVINEHNTTLKLYEGSRQAYDTNANMTILYFDSLIIELPTTNKLIGSENYFNRDLYEYYIHELFNPDKRISQKKSKRMIIHGHQRMTWPLYNIVLTYLGLAIYLRQSYNKKSTLKPILYTLIATIIVTMTHFVVQNAAATNIKLIIIEYINLFIFAIISKQLYKTKTI